MTYSSKTIAKSIRTTALPLLLTTLMAGPAFAADAGKQKISAKYGGERIKVTVSLSSLETDEGTQALYAKLNEKAVKSCKGTIPVRIGRSVPVERCAKRLVDGFVADLDHEGLTSIHSAAKAST